MSGAAAPVEIRPYRPGDEAAIGRAFTRAFGVERSLGEWAWKFPAEGGARDLVYLAWAGDEVVAQFAAEPVAVEVDGRRLTAGHAVDAFALPAAGGLARRGVYARTVERFYAERGGPGGLAFLVGFPGTRHLALGRRLLGYVEPVPVPWFRRDELPGGGGGGEERRPARRSLADRLARRAVSAEANRAADDRLWARAARRYPVAAVRDGARLARRFGGRPGVDYRRRTVWRRGEPRATAVFRVEGGLLRWADLVWDGTSEADLAALDRAVAAAGRAAGARAGELWLGGDAAAVRVLSRRGWRRERHPQDLHLTAVSLTPGLDVHPLVPRFYVTLGDSDLV